MVPKALSTLLATAVLGLLASAAAGPSGHSSSLAAANAATDAGGPPVKPDVVHDQLYYSYCDSCWDKKRHKLVSVESDVFVPPQVLDMDVGNHGNYPVDIAMLPGHGLALGLSRQTCVHPTNGSALTVNADAPYQSGPPPPIGDPLIPQSAGRRRNHHCTVQTNKESPYCRIEVQGGIPEIGGVLFADADPKAAPNSYIFIPCAYVPVLGAPTGEGAGEFRRLHPQLTLSCAGNATVNAYPHQYRNFSCRPSAPSPQHK
jgi:hypothetical protein